MVREIELTQGLVALVDDEDYGAVSEFAWCAILGHKTYYATRNIPVGEGKYRQIRLHRQILGLRYGDGTIVDHADGNGLNNQRYNLRICTHADNMRNHTMRFDNTSGYTGVYATNRKKHAWIARIKDGDKMKHLGVFSMADDAAKAYNDAAIKLYGEFAHLNEVPE